MFTICTTGYHFFPQLLKLCPRSQGKNRLRSIFSWRIPYFFTLFWAHPGFHAFFQGGHGPAFAALLGMAAPF
jgi:hypothetical protein